MDKLYYPEKGELPEDGLYVLAHHTRGTWCDSDQEGCEWVVVKFIRGLSEADREALPDTDARKRSYECGDEEGNNCVPYAWETFGPGSFFGQEIDAWCHLPRGQVPIARKSKNY